MGNDKVVCVSHMKTFNRASISLVTFFKNISSPSLSLLYWSRRQWYPYLFGHIIEKGLIRSCIDKDKYDVHVEISYVLLRKGEWSQMSPSQTRRRLKRPKKWVRGSIRKLAATGRGKPPFILARHRQRRGQPSPLLKVVRVELYPLLVLRICLSCSLKSSVLYVSFLSTVNSSIPVPYKYFSTYSSTVVRARQNLSLLANKDEETKDDADVCKIQ